MKPAICFYSSSNWIKKLNSSCDNGLDIAYVLVFLKHYFIFIMRRRKENYVILDFYINNLYYFIIFSVWIDEQNSCYLTYVQ